MATIEQTLLTFMVPMRDGVRLATDIYLPAGHAPGQKLPVLLERTPYDRRGTNHGDFTLADPEPRSKPELARAFAAAGYACVLQDCRGRYGSEGVFTKYLNEAEDGADTLAWLLEQPWCDGRVGTLGLSYGAHVQSALACLDPPGLKAMFLDSGGFSSAYHGGARQGGAFELKQLTWARKHALLAPETEADPLRKAALEAEDIQAWIGRRWARGNSPLAAAPEYEDYILEQWDNDSFSPFWRRLGIYARGWYDRYADVPMVHMSSWYDPYSQTAIDNFTGLAPIKRGPVKLVLGPWTHGQRSASFAGDVDFGPAAPLDGNLAPDYVTLRRDWFDRHLRGLGAPEHLPAPVRIFVMGGGSGRRNADGRLDHGGRWRNEQAWPLPGTVPTILYLTADRTLSETPPCSAAAPLAYDVDPADPVPTLGGAITSGAPVMYAGAYDQSETAARADVLVFETAPLPEDLELTGSVVACLYVSSSAVDTDFTIKLIDLYPPSEDYPQGFAMNLAHGILRTRFRHSFENPEPMEPGAIHDLAVPTFPTSNLFGRGHRIRIEISSSNFPHFDVNPNVDWRVPGAAPQVARNSVHVDRDHASYVMLPVIPPTR
ncbi:MAG: cocE [Sphingomonas bacterium]|uniref:CocE/NonD family hydrolase n=1 Tax=Sphingomonas bacterium TaxID=1895847 RepID=UPI00260AC3C8|nr:CocE/NonD family hydrolase [Sphingomonas bacterium]MDB5705995.1 cocE [Sphingomonas bacterium]